MRELAQWLPVDLSSNFNNDRLMAILVPSTPWSFPQLLISMLAVSVNKIYTLHLVFRPLSCHVILRSAECFVSQVSVITSCGVIEHILWAIGFSSADPSLNIFFHASFCSGPCYAEHFPAAISFIAMFYSSPLEICTLNCLVEIKTSNVNNSMRNRVPCLLFPLYLTLSLPCVSFSSVNGTTICREVRVTNMGAILASSHSSTSSPHPLQALPVNST